MLRNKAIEQPVEAQSSASVGLDYEDRLKWTALENRIVYLYEEIRTDVVREKSMELQDLLRRSKDPITIMVSSPGGIVLSGLALYDEIMELRKQEIHVTMRICGCAASMGAIVLQAGTVREALANSRLLIHEVSRFSFFAHDTSSDLEEQVVEMKRLQTVLLSILSERSGKSLKELERLIWKRTSGSALKKPWSLGSSTG